MNKGFATWVFSSLGVVAVFVVIVVINALGNRAKTRIDLTEEHAYTLSNGTRAILKKLDTPVQIRFYATRGENRMPVLLKTYAQRVEDLLGEFQQASGGHIEVQKLDPVPDSDAEDSAKLDGVEGQQLPTGDPIYLGLSVSMLDQKQVIPFLGGDSPESLVQRERLLEYEIARAISRVMVAEKPVIGVMTPLAISGRRMNPMMMQMGQRGQPAWAIYSELSQDFNLKTVDMAVDKIPDDIKLLVVIHPKGITDTAQYAIDQFILRGGKLIAFLDPQSVLDQNAQQSPMGMGGGGSSSSMDKLLKGWGLNFTTTQAVADLDYTGRTGRGRNPAVLQLNENALNKDDVVTSDARNVFLVFAGAFTGKPTEGLKQTVLIKSSQNSELVDPMTAQMNGEKLIQDFVRSATEYPLALRLTGKFKTAFPEGKPKAPEQPPEPGKTEEKKPDAPAEAGLKEGKDETSVILIGDADFIQDQVAVQEIQNPFNPGQRMVMPTNGNLAFAQGAIEQLTGDNNLISVRSRASRERQFTVVNELQAKAESAFQAKIKGLETSYAETQTKINELQRAKTDKGQKFILSPEQQQEIENLKKKESEVKKELKEERKKLRSDIDELENWVKILNIGLMPAIVAVAGVGLALIRHQRRAAR